MNLILPSFPRKRESIFPALTINMDSRLRGNDGKEKAPEEQDA